MARRRHAPPVAHPVAAYRREGETILIEIALNHVAQIYNSFDPSPFNERELDTEADRYIFTSAREIGADKPFKLVIDLPPESVGTPAAKAIEQAIRNHYLYRLQTARRDLRHELRRGRTSLFIGLAFLIACMAGREFALSLWPSALQRIFGEGLLIIGWVAMWGPLEVFLYGWWPIAGTCRILERLAVLDVELRPRSAAAPGLVPPAAGVRNRAATKAPP
ncbi:MAG: hypothetical protein KIT16_23770 [Rhodospirillaceae bacterium]|nr:hypothetical protein [Rhodospirillaceae bacterium]